MPGKTPKNNWAVNFLVFPGSRTGDSDKAMDNTARQQFQLINGASNAGDLALLMAFAGVAHNGSSGIRALNAYQGKKDTAKPVGYDNVVKELGTFGYDPGK